MDPVLERELAWKFAPILHLHPDEDYLPMDPQEFIANSWLWLVRHEKKVGVLDLERKVWTDDVDRIPPGLPQQTLGHFPATWGAEDLSWSRRPFDPRTEHNKDRFVLQHKEKRPRGSFSPVEPPPVFFYAEDRGPSTLISYWFFYGYSHFNWFIGHQGDWEHVTFEIRNGQIDSAFFAVHEDKHFLTAPGLVRVNGRVRIYSAKGRHATWWKEGEFFLIDPTRKKETVGELLERDIRQRDETEAGPEWDPRLHMLPLRSQLWRRFGGAWGDLGKTSGGTGPLGPWYKTRLDANEEVVVEKQEPTPVRSSLLAESRITENPIRSGARIGPVIRRRLPAALELVFVHGRSQQDKNPDTLKAEWIQAWQSGLAKNGLTLPIPEASIRFPYYGDTLDDLVHGASPGTAASIRIRSALRGSAPARDLFVEIAEEYIAKQNRTREYEEFTAQRAANLPEDPYRDRGFLNWEPVQNVLEFLDRIPGVSEKVIALVTNDVAHYLRDSDVRDTIDSGTRLAIRPNVPTVIVAHSLGTVVAYNLLRQESSSLLWDIPLFVTLGSPLAVSAIRKEVSPLFHPPAVGHWFNAADKRDVVPLFPLDSDHFPVIPPIENHLEVRNETPDHHGIRGYLEDSKVALKIYLALTSGSDL